MSDNAVGSNNKNAGGGSSFLSNLGILLGVAAVVTLVLVGIKPPNLGTSAGIQFLQDGAASTLVSPTAAFSFRAFGYTVVLPEYAPGYACYYSSHISRMPDPSFCYFLDTPSAPFSFRALYMQYHILTYIQFFVILVCFSCSDL